MARVRVRGGPNGIRYMALYIAEDGEERSAGTYEIRDRALEVAKDRERWGQGVRQRVDPVIAATATWRSFVPTYMRFAQISGSTKRQYESVLKNHILPVIGNERLAEAEMETGARVIASMREKKASASMQRCARTVMSSIQQVAIVLGYRKNNSIRGLPLPRQKAQRHTIPILIPAQFTAFRDELPTRAAQMAANTIAGSGIRGGECWALEVADLVGTKLDIYKSVSEAGEKYSLSSERFDLNGQPKDGWARQIALQPGLVAALCAYIADEGLGPNDLLFPHRLVMPNAGASMPKYREELTPERLAEIEREHGRWLGRYRHGTPSAYTKGCRCEFCRQAMTEYRNRRRREDRLEAQGLPLDTPKATKSSTRVPLYVSRHAWLTLWDAAADAAGIFAAADASGLPRPKPKHLRHSHASWLINAGEKPAVVMDRLGHSDLSVTSRYVQMLDHSESTIALLDNLINF